MACFARASTSTCRIPVFLATAPIVHPRHMTRDQCNIKPVPTCFPRVHEAKECCTHPCVQRWAA
eukprot:11983049-Alexandrium_andersonii.AAC.1